MKKLISISSEPAKTLSDIVQYETLMRGSADFFHCDVMKQPFVNRDLFDFSVLKEFSKTAKIPLDIHLMTENLKEKYEEFFQLQPHFLTVHFEAFENKDELKDLLQSIRKNNIKAGLSIKMETPISKVQEFFPFIDLLLIMSVEIGKSGQKFNEKTYDKIKEAKQLFAKTNHKILIEVDGGVNEENASKLFDCGADILVSGSFVYHAENKVEAVKQLKK